MPETPPEQAEFSWKAHPARERRGPAVAAALTILGLGAGTTLFMGSVLWGVFAVVILLLALNRFFLPSRFTIDAEGLTAQYPLKRQRFRWAELRRIASDGRSAYLGTRSRRSRLDAYRGMHVLFGADGETVMRHIRRHVNVPSGGDATWAH